MLTKKIRQSDFAGIFEGVHFDCFLLLLLLFLSFKKDLV
jgi:hypothetical protein